MSLKYIRSTYAVPAFRGHRVRYTATDGKVYVGRVSSAKNAYIKIRWKAGRTPGVCQGLFHPKDENLIYDTSKSR